jgi:hypothetical protein
MANLKLKNPSGGSLNLVSADSASDLTVTFPATTGTASLTSQLIGLSQTTQVLTESRALNVTYTNSTGRPIVVYVSVANSVSSPVMLNQIDGVTIYGAASPTANTWFSMTLIVPIGSTYLINMNGTPTLQYWVETR